MEGHKNGILSIESGPYMTVSGNKEGSTFDSVHIIDYILEKSVSYQKKDGLGHMRPSFFWYDNDKDLKVCFLVTHVRWPSQTDTPACILLSNITFEEKKVVFVIIILFFHELSHVSFLHYMTILQK